MLVRSLLSLKQGLRVNDVKTKSILMSYLSPFDRYAFMDIDHRHVGTGIQLSVDGLSS